MAEISPTLRALQLVVVVLAFLVLALEVLDVLAPLPFAAVKDLELTEQIVGC